jgi:RNA polymerase sigma-70 factor (ECF subfamily)
LDAREVARFESVVLTHLDAAYSLARYLTRNDHDAEDIVQEACLRAFRHFDGYRGAGPGSARAWLLTIVRNTASSWRRSQAGATATEFDEALHSEAVADQHPEAALLSDATKETVRQALDRLPPEFREAILLRELQGLSYKEISEVVGVPVGTVMSRLSRARARLQQTLGQLEER